MPSTYTSASNYDRHSGDRRVQVETVSSMTGARQIQDVVMVVVLRNEDVEEKAW